MASSRHGLNVVWFAAGISRAAHPQRWAADNIKNWAIRLTQVDTTYCVLELVTITIYSILYILWLPESSG